MNKSAVISKCGKYRYNLSRIWDFSKPLVLFIMLNPSTADAEEDDATIRRCIAFAKFWGYGGLFVGNLYPYRTKDPKELKAQKPNVKANNENFWHMLKMRDEVDLIVCAWGNNEQTPTYIKVMMGDLNVIELSKKGIPKHPLYLKSNLIPKLWKPE